MEEWRPIESYEGVYEVSNQGRVRSLAREVHTRNQYGPCVKRLKSVVLSPALNSGGYPTVVLQHADDRTTVGVHKLVCAAFCGGATSEKWQAAHRDGVKTHNVPANLYWATPSENALDKVRHGGNHNANKTECIRGHEFTPDNTYLIKNDGGRMCRTCHRDYYRGYQRKKREAA